MGWLQRACYVVYTGPCAKIISYILGTLCGGASVLLALQPNAAHINDRNTQLMNTYRCIKDCPEALITALQALAAGGCTKEKYNALRARYNDKMTADENDVEEAALLIYLNFYCHHRMYRTNKRGLFNSSYNYTTRDFSVTAERIQALSQYMKASDVQIKNTNFDTFLADVSAGDFVYMDPPYLPVTESLKFNEYTAHKFNYDDHALLAQVFRRLDAIGAYVMVSNSNVPAVYDLYSGYNIQPVTVRRVFQVKNQRQDTELLITNY